MIFCPSLGDSEKIFLAALGVKLASMKVWKPCQLVGTSFFNLFRSQAKGSWEPDIRKLMIDENFLSSMTEIEKEAWISLNKVLNKF